MAAMTSVPDRMEVAVIGVGRMGNHHARTYAQMAEAELVAVVDADVDRAAQIADNYDCAALPDVDQLLEQYPGLKAATVAVPTVGHAAVTLKLLERGVATLVEKPLAPTLDEARQIAAAAERCGTLLQVGHTERFNPAVRLAAGHHVTPRYIEIHRVSGMTFRSLDIGVVMDLMIHDLDIVLSLVDSPLVQLDAVGVTVMGEHEDVANARLEFASGCVASLTASRLALKMQRKLRLFSENAYISLDYHAREGVIIRRTDNNVVLDEVRAQIEAGTDLSELDYTDLITIETLKVDESSDESDPLTAQARSFLTALRDGTPPEVDGAAGCAAIEAAERVIAAIRAHQWTGVESTKV